MKASMSPESIRDYDNAPMESFRGTLKSESRKLSGARGDSGHHRIHKEILLQQAEKAKAAGASIP